MKKFRQLSEQYREEGRHKLIYPKNKAIVSPRPESDSAKAKLGEEVSTPPIGVRSLYTKMYAKHGGTASQVKDAQSKAYAEVEKKHGKEMRNSLEAYHKKNMNEAVKDKFDIGEYDQEGDMAKSDLRSIIANSKRLHDMLKDDDNLPEWVQAKITKAEDYISTVANYMEAEMNEETDVSKEKVTAFHKKLDTLVHKTFGKRKEEMKEASSAYGRINARFKKLSGSSLEDTAAKHRKEAERLQKEIDAQQAENERRKAAMKTEEVELEEENKPTNPELWARAKALAKSKFDVWPSAYASGWASKWYKSKGGSWRSVNEENYEVTVMHTTKDGEKGEHTHKVTNADDARHAKNIALQKHESMLKSKGVEVRGMGTTTAKMVEQKENDLPFKADKPMKKSVVVDKKPEGYSIARQLARQAMQKQIEKMKKPVKEAEERGTEPFLTTSSRKSQIVKDAAKKSKNSDKFESQPVISDTVTRNY